jgi:multidrug efflux pump subunit AcrA (membrane-fusion protein)
MVVASQSAAATTLPEQLSTVRSQVDSLAEQLENQRRATRDELAALHAERAELQRQIRLERIRRDTLAKLRTERSQRLDLQEGRILTLLKPIQRSLVAVKHYVSVTLPFKREERMRRLEKIEADLAVTHPDPGRALTQMWRFVEEEEALAREIDLSQQPIELDGQRLLVDVARIGMALMYFRLPDGDVGWVRRTGETWHFERLEDGQAIQTVKGIFTDLEKNRELGPKRILISTDPPPSSDRILR